VATEGQQKRNRELMELKAATVEATEAKARIEELTRLNKELLESSDASLDDDLAEEPRENPKLKSMNDKRASGILYVVRHEESEGNVARRKWFADGKPEGCRPPTGVDHPLSERGATRLADTTAKFHADHIVDQWRGMEGEKRMVWMVSPMRRALRTAEGLYGQVTEIARARGIEIEWGGRFVEPLLVEHGGLKAGGGLTLSRIRQDHSWLQLPGAGKPLLHVI
jgi:hypothetical protein